MQQGNPNLKEKADHEKGRPEDVLAEIERLQAIGLGKG